VRYGNKNSKRKAQSAKLMKFQQRKKLNNKKIKHIQL